MNDKTLGSIDKGLVPANYLSLANDARQERDKQIKILLEKRKLPQEGWSEPMVEYFIQELALLDSNNFPSRCGVGEREARVVCDLVRRRHYNFAHGVGRSGNLTAAQPKAAGSTLMANLTNCLVLDLIRTIGVPNCKKAIVMPLATGMTVMLSLRAVHSKRPQSRYVLWSRVDQQSCFKSILAAGLVPIVVDSLIATDDDSRELKYATDLDTFQAKVEELGKEQICCILSTTSCFAPRNSDDIITLADLCLRNDIPHIVNNAYGLQSSQLLHQINQAARTGRVDVFVQSTDKNLLVPVGGAIVGGCYDGGVVDAIAGLYPGRASGSQSLDVLMTLLTLGITGYRQLLEQRNTLYKVLLDGMIEIAAKFGEIVLPCRNSISIGISLRTFNKTTGCGLEMIGSMLQKRGVSGCRVVTAGQSKSIEGYLFEEWGAHSSLNNVPYLTASAALGVQRSEIDTFLTKLPEVLHKFRSKYMPGD
ncbi:O-phosphoseryl-tRNA(Sec) selenium transferase-like [Anopheles albimanus]|uniref:O-phosphoseryl-tRNA(Sec) selenium transferase n=1 Tax=Anopheles albimanus TaxID=7167 RepID=A0A182FKW5_ANOAL|nr:O-phosphoseryl-tRNA(Sec) selenium transferase-like [Anopheles albimanus]